MTETNSEGPRGIDQARADTSAVRSVLRAVALLEYFDEQHLTWTVSELARQAGLPKTTVIRLVVTLEKGGLLWTRPDGRISVAARMLRWVRLAETAWRVPVAITGEMRALADRVGETVNLYVRQGTVRVCIAQQEGTQSLRHVVRMGAQLPIDVGAASLILLQDAGPRELEKVKERGGRLTDGFIERVHAALEQGYAVSHGEREAGASGVAVPIRDRNGRVLAALALGGPTSRFTEERIAVFVGYLRQAAKTIEDIGLDTAIPAHFADM
jgi:DNA-binding IclR family transcriptional regulator